ncbi:MAG: class I SAM-dependent methyltransferase [Candidatus Bathyarchaeia archaeon]
MGFYDDRYAQIYDLLYLDIKHDIPFYLEYAKRHGSPILEIACGTGRVLIPLAEAGYEVWGIDFSPSMLAKARQNASVLPPQVTERIHLVQADMRDFQLDLQFPLALIPFRSFLVLLTVGDQIRTLNNIRRHMKEGGILVIDLFVPRYDALSQGQREATKEIVNPENKHVLYRREETTYDHVNQLIKAEYTFEEHDEKSNLVLSFRKTLELRYIFRYEMEHLLSLSEFDLEEVYGTFDKEPYDYQSGEMIFVASKT